MTEILSQEDLASPVWQKLRVYLQARIDSHRRKNDNDLSPEATAKLRGRLAEAQLILKLENPRTVMPED